MHVDQLSAAAQRHQSMLCVGLDPDPARFPGHLKGDASKIYDFCAAIVDSVADLVVAFKPQIAYFHAHRAEAQTPSRTRRSTVRRRPPAARRVVKDG